MIYLFLKKNWVFGYSWSTLLWYRCYYLHRSRDALSPIRGIFLLNYLVKELSSTTKYCSPQAIKFNQLLHHLCVQFAPKPCLHCLISFSCSPGTPLIPTINASNLAPQSPPGRHGDWSQGLNGAIQSCHACKPGRIDGE